MWSDLRRLWQELIDELRAASEEAKAEYVLRKWEIDNPGRKAVTEEEADAIVDWFCSLTRPALILRPDPAVSVVDTAARIGGPAWLADDEQWPLDGAGGRLEFVAQLDFARLPRLEGFPDSGVLRFFVGRDELFGANWDAPEKSGCCILWHAGPATGGRLEAPHSLTPDDISPFQSETVRAVGQALSATPADTWHVAVRLAGQDDRPGMAEVDDRIFEISEEREPGHRIGGHPVFVQTDFRRPGYYDDYDVVLLGLTSDSAIMWGDVGEATFLIRQADLDRRNFSRVVFHWDCH